VSDGELRLERLIAAQPDSLFELWTEPELLVTWWGPQGHETTAHDLDVRLGGRWRMTMRAPDGASRTVSGVYRAVEPPRRLVFTWAFDEGGVRGDETEVVVTFEAVPGGTRLVLLQRTFAVKAMLDRHQQGWSSSFERLARIAQG
jgi:uncharacterized protein YndB with AHSA1/START domain